MRLMVAFLLGLAAWTAVAARPSDLPKLPPAVDDPTPEPEISERIVIKEDLVMPPPPPMPPPGDDASGRRPPQRRDSRSSDMWRAYARLSEQERREMNELQAKDSEGFRKAMQALAEKFQQEKREQEHRLKELLVLYQGATAQERRMIESYLTKIIRTEYLENLAEHHSHLKVMKERVAKLEKEVELREKNADSAIQAIVGDLLRKAVAPEAAAAAANPPVAPPSAPPAQ